MRLRVDKYACALLLVIISSLCGCYGGKTPLLIVQTSILPYGKRQILKEAFGKYRFFRNTGWQQAVQDGHVTVIATAKPDTDRTLSGIRARVAADKIARDQFNSNEQKYRQYLTTVAYDFTFYLNTDATIVYGGVVVREFVEGETSIKKKSPDEQTLILRMIAEQVFPTWLEEDMKHQTSLQ